MTPEGRAKLRAAAERNVTVRDVQLAPDVVIDLLDTISALTERAERAERERDEARSEAVDHATDADARQLIVTTLTTRLAEACHVRETIEAQRDKAIARAERAEQERDRMREAMPTDDERATVVQVFDEAWFQDRDKIRPWLARLDAVRNGGE